MAARKKIAINFFTDYKQAAGLTIYLINIIRTLNLLPDNQKPEVMILHTVSAPVDDIKELNYPYLSFFLNQKQKVFLNFFQKSINKISKRLHLQKPFRTEIFIASFPADIALIYPYFYQEETAYIAEKVYWKADFQEKYYPEFFPQSDLKWSDNFLSDVSKKTDVMVLSSYDALKDYKKFYPDYKNQIKLLRFASQLPRFAHVSVEEMKTKFNIEKPFFLIANQFWPHKNHLTVLKAINNVKHELNSCFVFTGNTSSYRDSSYFPMLMNFVEQNNLTNFIKFTGFINRAEQLQLMKHAIAVIQPSLFEGWSTVIEDCKALNQFVIASDLAVNMEQAKTNAIFFPAMDDAALSNIILQTQNKEFEIVPVDYNLAIEEFKKDVINVLNI